MGGGPAPAGLVRTMAQARGRGRSTARLNDWGPVPPGGLRLVGKVPESTAFRETGKDPRRLCPEGRMRGREIIPQPPDWDWV